MSAFFELYQQIQDSKDEFYVGETKVLLEKISDLTFNFLAEASNTVPNPASLSGLSSPENLQKWRATYVINGRKITNYLTAQNKLEARRMLYDYLSDFVKNKQDLVAVAKQSELEPVNSWNELVRLIQYSMKHTNRSFDALDNGDIAKLLAFIKLHPDFVKAYLPKLDEKTAFYIKRIYNHAMKRDLDSDLGGQGNFWGSRVKDLMGQVGGVFKGLKTRKSPAKVNVPQAPELDNQQAIPFPSQEPPEQPLRRYGI